MAETYAKIAVSDVTYWVDRPYDYLVPSPMAEVIAPGMRVIVPFSRARYSVSAYSAASWAL